MSRGVLLFAFNSPKVNYYAMAEFTAKRVNHFLKLPVTLITDKKSLPTDTTYKFDNIIIIESDPSNNYRDDIWLNKGRYQAYDLTPYDETLLLDVDYMINSNKLLTVFDLLEDYVCHGSIATLMVPDAQQELMGEYKFPILWATVLAFKKTKKTKQVFDCMKMVQKNYNHYGAIYNFDPDTYRNDYALTIAHKIVHGQLPDKRNILPWNLLHVWLKTDIVANTYDEYNTSYTVIYDNWKNNKIRKEYITMTDMDFHVINKELFLELMK